MSLQINLTEIEKARSFLLHDLLEAQGEVIEVSPEQYCDSLCHTMNYYIVLE